mmetsp:Transcript_15456/g.58772  ORF Transcript_15456/g.58772 Transcript_15456/m.58772 type:complete len:206 (-) Transcript_15456:2216-2833(-)
MSQEVGCSDAWSSSVLERCVAESLPTKSLAKSRSPRTSLGRREALARIWWNRRSPSLSSFATRRIIPANASSSSALEDRAQEVFRVASLIIPTASAYSFSSLSPAYLARIGRASHKTLYPIMFVSGSSTASSRTHSTRRFPRRQTSSSSLLPPPASRRSRLMPLATFSLKELSTCSAIIFTVKEGPMPCSCFFRELSRASWIACV